MSRILVIGLLMGSLVGCTPAPIPIVALAVQDGEPYGVLVVCGERFSSLSVYQNDDALGPDGPLYGWGCQWNAGH